MAKGRRSNHTGRSAGESRHVRLYHWVLNCAAYRSLAPASRALLVELYALYDGGNNGSLFLSVREAAKRINVSHATAGRALADLQRVGFIRAVEAGSFSRKSRHATTWLLTEFGHAGQSPTKDFMRPAPTEIQNAVSPVRLTVLTMRPNGVARETEARKTGPYGVIGETVAARETVPQSHR